MSFNKIIMVVLTFVVVSVAAWDGSSIRQPSKVTIDGRNYYQLESPEELAWFSDKVNGGDTAISAVLAADIDLNMKNWTPIGKDTSVAYDGVFDGNHHVVSGINVSNSMYAGLFGVVDVGVVKKVTIDNSNIEGFYTSNNGDFYSYVGGIAGLIKSEYGTVENAINKSNLKEPQNTVKGSPILYMGGVVGYSNGSIKDCENEADLIINEKNKVVSKKMYVGGIVGETTYYYSNSKNLINRGTIIGGDNTGGIVGACVECSIQGALNEGDISGSRMVGGVCGYGCVVNNVSNNGKISVSTETSDSLYLGGICGRNCLIKSSINYGKIHADGLSKEIFAGGIMAMSDYYRNKVNTVFNYGDISISSSLEVYVGGIVGFLEYCDSLYSDFSYAGNYGEINGQSMEKSYVGGITGYTKINLSNVFNQGSLNSSDYAAGIVPILPQRKILIKNFYVAADSIVAPNSAAFVYYNSVTTSLKNGYFDIDRLKNVSPIEENLGVAWNIYGVDTKTLQSDSLAFALDSANCGNRQKFIYYDTLYTKENHWTRDTAYPIFSDSIQPIYRVVFVWHKSKICNKESCALDSVVQYTDSKGLVKQFPQLDGVGKWFVPKMDNSHSYLSTSDTISKNHKFSWKDSLVVALYSDCNDSNAAVDLGCCINYMLEFQKEYAKAFNARYGKIDSGKIYSGYCQDENEDGILNWNDSTSSWFSMYASMERTIESIHVVESSSGESSYSSSEVLNHSSSSSEPISSETILNVVENADNGIKVVNVDRSIYILSGSVGNSYSIMDIQGRVIKKGYVKSKMFVIKMPMTGDFIIRIGYQLRRIYIR